MATKAQPVAGRHRDWIEISNRAILWLAKHWLGLINVFWALYAGLPFLAPALMHAGWTVPAQVIYTIYRPACHQRPDRSFFIDGPKMVYSAPELEAAGVRVGALSRDIGNQAVGWKVAFCERDVAIYGALFLGGLGYALLRRRRGRWLLKFRYYLIFLIPIGLDGTLQLLGLYESTWLVRTLTGAWFGLGSVLFAYPYLDDASRDVREGQERKLRPTG